MKAHPIENQNTTDDKETLSALIDLMGQIDGGIDNEEFQELKTQMMSSGMSTEDLISLLGDNFAETIISRPIVDVKIQRLTDTAQIPTYSHTTDACADIYADEDITIEPGETHTVSTGLALAIPDGFVVHIYARSGLSVPIWNAGEVPYHIEKGMRIAQMDIMQSPAIEFYEVENIKEIPGDRLGGFGSSGLFKMPDENEVASIVEKLAEMPEEYNG